jgi:hypothetical protein
MEWPSFVLQITGKLKDDYARLNTYFSTIKGLWDGHIAGISDKHPASAITNNSNETGSSVTDALNSNKTIRDSHFAGSSNRHNAPDINYSGAQAGNNVKDAIDNCKADINNLSFTGSSHDALVTAALVDTEGENFGSGGTGTYLDGRHSKWENKLTANLADVTAPMFSDEISFTASTALIPADCVDNSQFNELMMQGNTAYQPLRNGNFTTTSPWSASRASLSVAGNIATITGQSGNNSVIAQGISYLNIVPSERFFIRAMVMVTNSVATDVRLQIYDGSTSMVGASKTTPTANQWYPLYGIINITAGAVKANSNIAVVQTYADDTTHLNKVMSVKEVMIIDMGADSSNPLYALTADQMNSRYPNWFDGVQSVKDLEIKSSGKNLLYPSVGTVSLNGIICSIESDGTITLDGTASADTYIKLTNGLGTNSVTPNASWLGQSILPPAQYTLSRQIVSGSRSGNASFLMRTKDNAAINLNLNTASITSIASAGIAYSYIWIASGAILTSYKIKCQIELGAIANAWDQYKDGGTAYTAGEFRSVINSSGAVVARDIINILSGEAIQQTNKVLSVASGTTINYADMKDSGWFNAYAADGTMQIGQKGTTLTIAAATLIYQLASEVRTNLYGYGQLVAKPNGAIIVDTDSIYPTIAYKYGKNLRSKINGNTNIAIKNAKDIKAIFADYVSIKALGAKGDGVSDDTAVIQAAFDNPALQTIYFPSGNYLVKALSGSCLSISRHAKIFGDGMNRSSIIVDPTTPSTVDVLKVSGQITNLVIQDIGFTYASGTPARHAIHIDLSTTGHFVKNSFIEKCYFNEINGHAIHLTNPTNVDGFFTSRIGNNLIYGGIFLERSGDSVLIEENTITGVKAGIEMTTVTGAYRTYIGKNNITSDEGQIVLTNVSEVSIIENQIEQTAARASTNHACIEIDGGYNIIIENNNFDTNGYIDYNLRVNNTKNIIVDKNNFHTSNKHIDIKSGAVNTYIGYKNNSRKNGIAVNNLVIDNAGIGTTNIDVPVTLENGWTNYDSVNYGAARCHKTQDGTCHLKGSISGGTVTVGTQLFVLPEGFRPSKTMYAICYSHNGSSAILGSIRILQTGEVSIRSGANNLFTLDGVSFKADNYLL